MNVRSSPAPARAPARARPADATAQAPRPAPHSPPLALHGSLRCPRGRAGAALVDGHRPKDAIRPKIRSEAGLRKTNFVPLTPSPPQPRSTPHGRLGACGGFRGPARRSDVRPAGCALDGRTDRGHRMCPSVGPSGFLPHIYRPESAAGLRPAAAGGAPGAMAQAPRPATPSMARLAVPEAALARLRLRLG